MSKISIVTDSSVTLPNDMISDLEITVVPLSVLVDGVVYSDNDLKEAGKFRSLMQSSKELPKTSQPPVGVFAETYENLVATGTDKIISIHLSHSLSGTLEAARQGAIISEKDVTVLDSGFTDQAMAFQVVKAAQLAQEGLTLERILEEIEVTKQKTELFIGVSTLENLVKGGRVSKTQGLISSLLNIKVMMQLKDGSLSPIVKGRGTKVFTRWLTEWKEQLERNTISKLGISYSGTADFAESLKEKLSDLVHPEDILVLETGSIIQTHTGEGAFAVMVEYE